MTNCLKLTIIFDAPFYKGIFENQIDNKYFVAAINLGTSEPKIRDIYQLILQRWQTISFYASSKESSQVIKNISVKKMQKQARQNKHKILKFHGTKAQQVLQIQHNDLKLQRKQIHKQQQLLTKQQQFELKQLKRREKHKGH